MNDLALDPITGDLLVTGLDLEIIQGAAAVRQNIAIKLKLWTGEWFLDTEFGTPYLTDILGKQISISAAVAALKQSILAVNDVNAITDFTYNFSRQTRVMSVAFTASTNFGLIPVTA
jgi:hypothetical protein